jgi:hypothetical protein
MIKTRQKARPGHQGQEEVLYPPGGPRTPGPPSCRSLSEKLQCLSPCSGSASWTALPLPGLDSGRCPRPGRLPILPMCARNRPSVLSPDVSGCLVDTGSRVRLPISLGSPFCAFLCRYAIEMQICRVRFSMGVLGKAKIQASSVDSHRPASTTEIPLLLSSCLRFWTSWKAVAAGILS